MRITLLPRRARPFFARHPWVFANSIARIEGEERPGAEADVWSHEGKWIARGLYNPLSLIRVRLYRWEEGPLDGAFWRDRLASAIRLRRDVLRLEAPGAAYRAVFSESDGLSGLTVDRFDRWLVAQFTSRALLEHRSEIVSLLLELTAAEGLLLRTDRGIAGQEGLPDIQDAVEGSVPEAPVSITENGVDYAVDLRAGQKTGFYLDQRDNRRAVSQLCQGKAVLDLFCYSGGFGVTALRGGGAERVLGIDSSAPAIVLARQNAVTNHLSAARFEQADVFDAMEKLRTRQERFGVVICDPPKFARNARGVDEALKAYLRLNRAAVHLVEPDGILVTCSCSGHVDRTTFAQMLGQVAELAARPIQILEQRGQAADHPVSTACLETDYLKCFVCRVGAA
jgi:23S rRNA (cytosine1962-C5)-methyltransferase